MSNNYKWSYLNSPEASPMYEEIAATVQYFECSHVLDLGCGYSRINDFLPSKIRVDGIDSDTSAIEYCNIHWLGRYTLGNILEVDNIPDDSYDCILLSGFLYYLKEGITPDEYIDLIVEKFNPKIIIISEPRPSISYKSPNFTKLFDNWAWVAKQLDLDIRMGNRVIYTLFTDKKRPERKIKAEFNENSEFDHQKQQDFDEKLLKHWVYTLNTENINNDRDGLLFPKSPDINQYVSVCAGYKSLYKACIDWYPGKPMQFMYIDVVQQALDYRMYMDMHIGKMSHNNILSIYKKDINNDILEYPQGADIDAEVDKQLEELNIKRDVWDMFLAEYRDCIKHYVKIDAVNNIKLFSRILDTQDKTWFWYSNIHDWHQFRFTEKTFDNWCYYLLKRNPQLRLVGKMPPFTSD